jgi:hypothetical protein
VDLALCISCFPGGTAAVWGIWAPAYGTTRLRTGCVASSPQGLVTPSGRMIALSSLIRALRRLRALGPRRTLQLSLVVAAALALLLALTGAVGPAAAAPVPASTSVIAP